ncbi:DNA primase [Christensenellaceae bacterium OttesenSCG-928-L17]|nr:DNA primase [Christensenellaceae bacterium OttesenSCG-928-L17]
MARFNDAWMDMLLSKNDIVSVVSSYVPLKSKGRNLWGLCPFHNEKTASFSVAPDKQMYYCFGCGAGGGVVQFVMEMERLPYIEAVQFLAQRAGMELPERVDDVQMQRERAHKERLYAACKEAARFFHDNLSTDEGKPALEYLFARGVSAQIIKKFGLGYARDSWDALQTHLQAQGFTDGELLDAGLLVKNAKSGKVYDAFRNRVIFPIIGANARVLGFGARGMGNETPKYINTSETPIYNKRRNLYALNYIKGARTPDIVIVEGYMDAISLHAAGITNAVASLGTSLTEQQARLIKRYAPNVYIAYDGDAAGQNATLRGLDILQKEGLRVRVIVLPEGMDPDDFVRKNGRSAFEACKDEALALNEFKLVRMAARYDLKTEDGRQDCALEGCKFIATLQPVEQERYYKQLSRLTGLPQDILRAQGGTAAGQESSMQGETRYFRAKTRTRSAADIGKRQAAELALLRVMAEHPVEVRDIVAQDMNLLFQTPAYLEFAKALHERVEGEKPPQLAVLMSEMEPAYAQLVAEAVNHEANYDNPQQYAVDCVAHIRRLDAMEELRFLQAQAADPVLPLEEKLELMEKISALKQHAQI